MKNEKFVLTISQDENVENPREWDNRATMICFHRRYTLGDKTDLKTEMFNSWDELKAYLIKEKKAVVIAPLYLYDHSGLRIKIGSFNGLLSQGHAEFDSGQVGFIFIDKDTMKRNKLTKKGAEKVLEAEVNTYDKYLIGDYYIFRFEKKSVCKCCGQVVSEVIDSCGGFESREDIEEYIKENLAKKYQKYEIVEE